MNLRDLVGRMAIRTDKVREVMPWEMERAFRLDFMVPVPIFDREKYMDEPVRILAVEGTQVVIEEDGKRKLLERRYIDERWTDYERLLHPEEEEKEKAEKLIANAKREVEESLIKSLEQNLKENLAKDTIERMNIPEVLKKLSSIGAKQVTGTSLPE
jgi:hypothetical protein